MGAATTRKPISSTEWEQLKKYFGFREEDAEILTEFRLAAIGHIDDVINDLYKWIFQFDEAKIFFKDESTIQKVKVLQKKHFITLTEGTYDMKFLEQRIIVGETHKRIGLPKNLYMGAYTFYMQAMLPRLLRSFEYDRVKQAKALNAMIKLFALDQALVLGAYFGED